jgi:hypothetical protein
MVFDSRGLDELLLKIRVIKHLFFIKIVNERAIVQEYHTWGQRPTRGQHHRKETEWSTE